MTWAIKNKPPSDFVALLEWRPSASPRIPPWPLRIRWWDIFRSFGSSFEVLRMPEPQEAMTMSHAAWDVWDGYPIRREYFPLSQRRWTRIRDAILKRRQKRAAERFGEEK